MRARLLLEVGQRNARGWEGSDGFRPLGVWNVEDSSMRKWFRWMLFEDFVQDWRARRGLRMKKKMRETESYTSELRLRKEVAPGGGRLVGRTRVGSNDS